MLLKQYKGMVKDFEKAEEVVSLFMEIVEEKRFILYGGGCVGRVLYSLFQELDVIVEAVYDKGYNDIHVTEKSDFKLSDPEELKRYTDCRGYYFVISTSNDIIEDVIRDIKTLDTVFEEFISGHDLHILLQSAFCMLKIKGKQKLNLKECYECTILDNTCVPLNRYLKQENNHVPRLNTIEDINMIGYILSSVCSLSCQHCCECVPYMEADKRGFVPKDVVIKDIEKLSSICDFLTLIEFIGGEPFLNKELVDIVEYVLGMTNVGMLHIFTNGTVLPSDALCESLANERITIYISNYQISLEQRFLNQIRKTVQKLDQYGVSYFFGKKQNWLDFTSFEDMKESRAYLTDKFQNCFLHHCNRLYRGNLYICPHHYAGDMLEISHFKSNILPIHEFNEKELIEKVKIFKNYPFIEACKYCKMPYKAEQIMSGIQLKKSMEGVDRNE